MQNNFICKIDFYCQSKAFLTISYRNPKVNINKNKIIAQKPWKPIEYKLILHGNKYIISISNIKNKIATI